MWERRGPVGGAASACCQPGPETCSGLGEGRGRPGSPGSPTWPPSPAPGVCAQAAAGFRAGPRHGENLPGRVGGAAVGSGKRVTWGLGRTAHVSWGNRSGRRRAVRGRKDARGLLALWGRGGGLATSIRSALTRSLGGNNPAVSENRAGAARGRVWMRRRRNRVCERGQPWYLF